MPRYKYPIGGGQFLTLEGDTQPSDTDVEAAAKQAGVNLQLAEPEPFDVNKQNATMRANMAKQHEGAPVLAHEFIRGVQEGTTPDNAGLVRNALGVIARAGPGRAMTGSEQIGAGDYKKGAHNLIAGGGTTAALMFAPEVIANPVTAATAMALGAGGDVVGRQTAAALGGDEDTQNLVGDVAGLATGTLGAKLGKAIPTEPVMRFVGREMARPGGVQGVVGRTIEGAADASEEIGHRVRGPIQDITRPSAQSTARARNAALTEAATIEADTKAAQHDEAIKTNKHITRDRKLAADALAAKDPRAMTGAEVAQTMRERLGLDPTAADGADADVPVPSRGVRGPAPQGTGLTRTVDMPLHAQQTAMENGEILTGRSTAEPPPSATASTPSHPQRGTGGRGQEFVPPPAPARATPAGEPDPVVEGNNGRPIVVARAPKGVEATLTSEERALIGNRRKGAMTLAERKALLDAIRTRSGK